MQHRDRENALAPLNRSMSSPRVAALFRFEFFTFAANGQGNDFRKTQMEDALTLRAFEIKSESHDFAWKERRIPHLNHEL